MSCVKTQEIGPENPEKTGTRCSGGAPAIDLREVRDAYMEYKPGSMRNVGKRRAGYRSIVCTPAERVVHFTDVLQFWRKGPTERLALSLVPRELNKAA